MYGQVNGNGIQICVEPLNEWKIQEIGYDGVEKYVKPPEFKDVLKKSNKRINWRRIIGNEASLDAEAVHDGEDSDEEEKRGPVPSKNSIEPVAGPWASVAKHLHSSLQEINYLLDAMRISRTEFLNPVITALLQEERESELIANSKAFHLCTRKKTLMDASKVIEKMATVRRGGFDFESEKGDFNNELKELRERWRIRKIGPNILGDLGYKIYTPKFAPHELFDISQKSISSRHNGTVRFSNPSSISIKLPHNLRCRTRLLVFVQQDDEQSADSLFKVESRPCVADEDVRHIHWKRALPWAQDSLMCKDILEQLVAESISQKDQITLANENSIAISLFDNYILRVELRFSSFHETMSAAEGVPYLSQCLKELFLAEHTKKPKHIQQFSNLPLSSLPEGLDMRGPQAFTAEEVTSKLIHLRGDNLSSEPLFIKFIESSIHYVLVSRTVDFLERHMFNFSDPQLQWKWIRATPNFTQISLNFTNRGFENLGKFSNLIRISGSQITLINKESQHLECQRDTDLLQNALLLLTAHFLLNTTQLLARAYGWQTFHANSNAFDTENNPAPSFYACNQTATKSILVQFHTNGNPPSIFIENSKHAVDKAEAAEKDFQQLNYNKIPGSTFMRKLDTILYVFSNN